MQLLGARVASCDAEHSITVVIALVEPLRNALPNMTLLSIYTGVMESDGQWTFADILLI